MSVGLNPQKSDVDLQAGTIARNVQVAMNQINEFQYWLAAKTDGDLGALGYTGNDIAVLRSAYNDLAQLVTIYQGTAALAAAKDFRTFVRQVWGMGDL